MPKDYLFKTDPYQHQEERFYLYRNKEAHAHLWEQRTGKSKVTIDTSAHRYSRGDIDGLLLIAPCGVHLNWVRNEIPTHMPDHIGCEPVLWTSKPNKSQAKAMERLMSNSTSLGLRCLSMNVEALVTKNGFDFAKQFLRNFRTMMVIDEGSVIKNMSAIRTNKILDLSRHAVVRRLLNGTPVTQSPLDVYPQFTFLDEEIFGTSYVAFRSHHAIIEMQGKMASSIASILENIAGRMGTYLWGQMINSGEEGVVSAGSYQTDADIPIEFKINQVGKTNYVMTWGFGRQSGTEKLQFAPGQVFPVITGYRNLDEMQRIIAPHSDRVLKKDCLDLPEKIYQKLYVDLSTKQQKLYSDIKKKCLAEVHGRKMTATLAMTKMLRCQQIIGGFFTPDLELTELSDSNCGPLFDLDEFEEKLAAAMDRKAIPIDDKNPRIEALMTEIEERYEGKILIWARFVAEIDAITKALRSKYGHKEVVELHGKIGSDIRQQGIDDFRFKDSPRFAVGNPACKGVSRGQNMCSASYEIYYSNTFSLEDRLQSEDRPHSPGIKGNLGVIDMVAPDTLDEKVIDALRAKKNLADQVTGDPLEAWI